MAAVPNYRLLPTQLVTSLVLSVGTNGCVVAAAGVGAGGAIYATDRGVESQVPASVEVTYEAARQAFKSLDVAERKHATEVDSGREKRTLDGWTDDRDVTITVTARGAGSVVNVVARHDEVIWDKKLARALLDRIVERAR